LAVDCGEWPKPPSGRFTPAKEAHYTGGRVGPRDVLDWWRKSLPHRDSVSGPSST